MARGKRSQITMTDIGPEKLCTKCGEWWPDDSEFYYLTNGLTIQPCKACYEQLPSVIRKRAKQRKPESAERWLHEH
ncbi:MAG TPA: hypothetical protein DD442_15595 [Halomonas sp.]|jgi:hypothetical protein|nr:hypothetical protein [Halomonas sp.]|tara:strand:- start:7708 stop:7935 length:228 start_codon:yes stop_codon:yes gene_type:complete